jgi:hypothetical protein
VPKAYGKDPGGGAASPKRSVRIPPTWVAVDPRQGIRWNCWNWPNCGAPAVTIAHGSLRSSPDSNPPNLYAGDAWHCPRCFRFRRNPTYQIFIPALFLDDRVTGKPSEFAPLNAKK